MKPWRISQFHGGNAIDEKLGFPNQFADTSTGIDPYYKPSILRGNLKMETYETGATTARAQDFLEGSDGVTYCYGYLLYGGANTYMQLWKLSAGTWSEAGVSTSSAPVEDSQIIEYKDHIIGYSHDNDLFTYGLLSGTPSFTEAFTATTNALTRHGPMAIQKDTLYIGNGNLVASLTDPTDSGTFTASALDLPSEWVIVSLAPWGKYLVIGARDPADNKKSKLFFWDTSATSWEFAKDLPEGELVGIKNIGDEIYAVITNPASDTDHIGYLNIAKWSGGAVRVVWRHRLPGTASATTLFRNNGIDSKSGILYTGGVLDTTNNIGGIYTYGQPVPGGAYAFNHAFSMATTTLQQFHCLKWIGTFLYASVYDATGTDYKIVRSDDTANAYEDLQYDSLIFDGGNPYREKEINSIIINTKALSTYAVITLKYKVNRASAWTTIGTMTTTDIDQKTFKRISGAAFNVFKELQLQITTNVTSGEALIETTGITVLYKDLEIPA